MFIVQTLLLSMSKIRSGTYEKILLPINNFVCTKYYPQDLFLVVVPHQYIKKINTEIYRSV